jgi:hypothetical protein
MGQCRESFLPQRVASLVVGRSVRSEHLKSLREIHLPAELALQFVSKRFRTDCPATTEAAEFFVPQTRLLLGERLITW